ncbi:MAG: beta family protein [Candidatus Limnocylindrales bacterium]|jgi:hypothetical protein
MSPVFPQLPLFSWPAFEPVPPSALHYVPVLLDWPGELNALASTPADRLDRMTPLIQIAPSAVKTLELGRWARDRVRRIGATLGQRPLYLDLLVPARSLRPLFEMVLDEARRAGLTFVPVHSVGTGSLDAAAASVVQDGRGVAIRYRAGTTVSMAGQTLGGILKTECDRLGARPSDADLIIDFGWMRPGSEMTAADLSGFLEDVLAPGPWRNVILAGTSVPRSLTEVGITEGNFGFIPRLEWRLWNDLHRSRPERIVYADYGIQSPKTPDKSKSGPMRANIRYTTPESILAVRGRGAFNQLAPEVRVQQYQELCLQLIQNPVFNGRACCSGDLTIELCADGEIGPTSQTVWRRVGANHHFAVVVGQLLAVEDQERAAATPPAAAEPRARPLPRRNPVRRPEPTPTRNHRRPA